MRWAQRRNLKQDLMKVGFSDDFIPREALTHLTNTVRRVAIGRKTSSAKTKQGRRSARLLRERKGERALELHGKVMSSKSTVIRVFFLYKRDVSRIA
jgi:hypothetical protein